MSRNTEGLMNGNASCAGTWFKSSFSGTGASSACVEVAVLEDGVIVRDSKDQTGPVLRFTAREWRAFLAGVRANEFDLR